MAAGADKLRAIPCKEVAGRFSDARGMREGRKANGTTAALVFEYPAEAEESNQEGSTDLDVLRGDRCDRKRIREIEWREVDGGEQKAELNREEKPAAKAQRPGDVFGAGGIFPQRKRCGGWKRQQRQENSE